MKKRTPHTFAGQQDGIELANWLGGREPKRIGGNPEPKSEDRSRIRIAQLVGDLNKSAETYVKEGKPDAELVSRIDKELSRYALKVKTVHVQDEGKYKTFAEPKWIFGWYSSAGQRAAEMIFRIVRLGERGLLGRVRQCDRCKDWFYAKFNHQRFCGKKCQLQHYQNSEEWKQRRRERYQNR